MGLAAAGELRVRCRLSALQAGEYPVNKVKFLAARLSKLISLRYNQISSVSCIHLVMW
jgi:hypothetical protein